MLIAQSVFHLERKKANGQTDKQTDHPTHASATASVDNN